jgi:hypothetical protein
MIKATKLYIANFNMAFFRIVILVLTSKLPNVASSATRNASPYPKGGVRSEKQCG